MNYTNEGGAAEAARTRGMIQPAGQTAPSGQASVGMGNIGAGIGPASVGTGNIGTGVGPLTVGTATAFIGSHLTPYAYPNELLDDCSRWRSLSYEQKIASASQIVPAWRVAAVVAELNLACGSPYGYNLYPYVEQYPWAFTSYYPIWQVRRPRTPDAPKESKEAPAGQVFYSTPFVWNVYPNELLDDCARWRTLTREQKFALAAQTVPAWRIALVVSDIDRACNSPYQYPIYPIVQTYYWAFPRYGHWHRRHYAAAAGEAALPINPAG